MAAIAAIQGWSRGAARGKSLANARRTRESSELRALRQTQKELADKIMGVYDEDDSGGLCRIELGPMLVDYSLQAYGNETQPSADDIEFLFKLCDTSGATGVGDDHIDRQEVLWIIDAWGEFMRSRHWILRLFHDHDKDQSASIDKEELSGVLNELKDLDKLKRIQPEVVEWIFEQADLNCNGFLSVIELARATCAYDMWLGKRTRCKVEPDRMMAGINRVSEMAAPEMMSDKDWKSYLESRRCVLEVLQKYDVNGDNQFEMQEMTGILVTLGVRQEIATQLSQAMDLNRDDLVTVDEFLAWVMGGTACADQVRGQIDPSSRKSGACCVIS